MRQTTINTWIINNAAKLKRRLRHNNSFDEDAFQDAYLSLVEDYTFPESESALEAAFIKAYRRIINKSLSDVFTTCHPDELFFTLLPSEDEAPNEQTEAAIDHTPLAKRIARHIRAVFPQKDVMAFEMRMNGFTFRDIADTLGIGVTAINNATQRIIAQTRLQFAAGAL